MWMWQQIKNTMLAPCFVEKIDNVRYYKRRRVNQSGNITVRGGNNNFHEMSIWQVWYTKPIFQ